MSDEEYEAYDSHIQQLEIDGYIERLQQDDVPECYLPHRGVVKSSSTTTKLRIVHDASARSSGLLSLNDALEKGPNLLPLLWGILLRFRVGRIAVVGDLEKAFLQITLQQKECNVCCFFMETAKWTYNHISAHTSVLWCNLITIPVTGCFEATFGE